MLPLPLPPGRCTLLTEDLGGTYWQADAASTGCWESVQQALPTRYERSIIPTAPQHRRDAFSRLQQGLRSNWQPSFGCFIAGFCTQFSTAHPKRLPDRCPPL